ncbi:hypothetical protein ACXWN6_09540, partial [Streptococcus pyogenes]
MYKNTICQVLFYIYSENREKIFFSASFQFSLEKNVRKEYNDPKYINRSILSDGMIRKEKFMITFDNVSKLYGDFAALK